MKWQKAFLREENTKYFLTDFQTEKFFCRKPGREIVMSDFRTEYSTKFRKSENISVCFPEKQTISSGYSVKSIAKHIKYERTDSFFAVKKYWHGNCVTKYRTKSNHNQRRILWELEHTKPILRE